MNLGEWGKTKPLLIVKVQKRRSFMSTYPKLNEKKCFYPITHWGYSDGGGILDQSEKKKSYKELNLPVTGDP